MPAFYAVVLQKRARVSPCILVLFYTFWVCSILLYASPSKYTFISINAKQTLEKYQRLCLHSICMFWMTILFQTNFAGLNTYLAMCCLQYVGKVEIDTKNCLHWMSPSIPTTTFYITKGLSGQKRPTALLGRSMFYSIFLFYFRPDQVMFLPSLL